MVNAITVPYDSMKMNYKTFCDKALYTYKHTNYSRYLRHLNVYHIVIHKLAFENFLSSLNENIIVFKCSEDLTRDHAHMLLWSNEQYKSSQNILSEPVQDYFHKDYILTHFIIAPPNKHDIVCNVTFNIDPLKSKCMKLILNNFRYSGHINKLYELLPKRIIGNIFQYSKFHYDFPKWDGKNFIRNVYLCKIDYWYDKNFVVCYQNTPDLYKDDFFIVHFYFLTGNTSNDKINLCLRCMNFEAENGTYRRKYVVFYSIFLSDMEEFVRGPENWCHACKQVPLFQTLTDYDMREKYNFNVKIFKKLKFFEESKIVDLKTDYFVNGILIFD